ncbi:hypothetical protein L0B52_09025 [Suttonella sp. R2A3]|uniref:hypothetical protein n=1 Tax=Suttonella sp. R2A3 TaxID=2908648 RepID=UPI001F43E1B9|nr:hypothetical protein [Suttonella sp. R2A3]UJF24456.1 hypothetical protein L0B52_09025 [Suttonella sp. R2A3]
MNKTISIAIISAVVAISGCAPQGYSGKGGMTQYSITSEAYEYHYKNGFTGVDAMGWDANLQYVWSRAGAAITCGIKFDKKLVLSQMTKMYGQSDFIHELNGVDFHHLQSKKAEGFCTPSRINEIKDVMPKFEKGDFPKYF